MLTLDNPEHDVRRRKLAHFFMPKRVETFRPQVQTLVDSLIDSMLAATGTVELVEDFALPIPSTIISHILGVPHEDHEFFQLRAKAFLYNTMGNDERQRLMQEFDVYVGDLFDSKGKNPADDIISYLNGLTQQGLITRPEGINDVKLLLVAGHHSTANTIALAALALMANPELAAKLRDAPDHAAVSAAVEEIVRYLSPLHMGRRRVALEEVELNGQLIKAGEGVIIANDAANWDPSAFDHPDVLDFHRERNPHGAFGFGIHQCLGQHLARVEIQVATTTLLRRLPALRPAVPMDELTYRDDEMIYGVWELPVTWDGRDAP